MFAEVPWTEEDPWPNQASAWEESVWGYGYQEATKEEAISPRPPGWRESSHHCHQPLPSSFLENFNTEESTEKEN